MSDADAKRLQNKIKKTQSKKGGSFFRYIKRRLKGCRNSSFKPQRTHFPKRIRLYSNPRTAQRMAHKYLGKTAKLYPARNPVKKYSICDTKRNKWVNFGQMGYEDYTKHHNKSRRKNYLTRTNGMLGDWKRNKYSANNLSRHILW